MRLHSSAKRHENPIRLHSSSKRSKKPIKGCTYTLAKIWAARGAKREYKLKRGLTLETFRNERPFGFLTPFRCEAPPNGFLTVSQRDTFWVFDTVFAVSKTFHQMRAFSVFEVFCSVYMFNMFRPLRVYLILTSILYPFEFLRSFAVLDHYVYNWPLRVFYTLLSFWRRLWRLTCYVYNWSLRVFVPFWFCHVVCGI